MNDFDRLAKDLTDVAGLVPKKAAQAVEQTAVRTRDEWRRLAAGNPYGAQYTRTISYDVDQDGEGGGRGEYSAEVGPDLGRYGGRTGKGGLVPSAGIFDDPINQGDILRPPDHAARDAGRFAEDELERGVEIAVEQSLREKGF